MEGRLCGWTVGLFPKDPKPEAAIAARGRDAPSLAKRRRMILGDSF